MELIKIDLVFGMVHLSSSISVGLPIFILHVAVGSIA